MNQIQTTTLVIILLYMALTVFIGLMASRKERKKQSNSDFLMAGLEQIEATHLDSSE